MTAVDYRLSTFKQLSVPQLYSILRLRAEVFVVEQDCPYQDLDGLDQESHHLEQLAGSNLAGYTRLLPPDLDFADACAIGRVITSPAYRRQGLGKQLMLRSIDACASLWPSMPIKLKAQTYLLEFYKSFRFEPFGKTFLEDGIPHIAMMRPA